MKLLILFLLILNLYSKDYFDYNLYMDTASMTVNDKDYSFNRLYINTYYKKHITNKISINNQMVLRTYKFYGSSYFNKSYVENTDYSFLSMYISYDFCKNKRISIGMIPFTNNSFSQYLFGNATKGNGITTLINTTVYGAFYSQRLTNNNVYSVGYFEYHNNMLHTFDYIIPEADNSPGIFVIDKYSNGFHYLEFNYMRLKLLYDYRGLGTVDMAALGYSYNRLSDIGYLLYVVPGVSYTNTDTRIVKDIITNSSEYQLYPFLYEFKKEQNLGYSVLVGARYENDNIIKNKTVFISVSYFRSSKYWVSMNQAKETKNNIYDIKGTSSTFNIGIQLNNHITLSYKHYYINRFLKKPGTVSDYLDSKRKTTMDVLFFNYKF